MFSVYLHSVLQPCQIWSTTQILYILVKSVTRQPNLWPGNQICGLTAKPIDGGKSVVRRPNLWHGGQICGMTAKSVARQPNLWHGGQNVIRQSNLWHSVQICGTAAKSVAQQTNLWHGGHTCSMKLKPVAWRPNLWHGSQICGRVAKSVAWRPNLEHGCKICGRAAKSAARLPNLWHSSLIRKQNRKFVYKRTKNLNIFCLKMSNFRPHIHFHLRACSTFYLFFWTGLAKTFCKKYLAARCLCSLCFWGTTWKRLQRHLPTKSSFKVYETSKICYEISTINQGINECIREKNRWL